MRRSAAEKAKSRERIVSSAATMIRESGVDAPSVADVMKSAGMTHGGFYKHFATRDDLVLAALEQAFADNIAGVDALLADATDPLATYVDWYLSTGHLSNPAAMCAVAALSGDVPRSSDPRITAAYRAQVERYLDRLEGLVGSRSAATVALSTLVGAVAVARAVGSDDAREEILRDVRAALKS